MGHFYVCVGALECVIRCMSVIRCILKALGQGNVHGLRHYKYEKIKKEEGKKFMTGVR